jgi:deoxyribonuclease-4
MRLGAHESVAGGIENAFINGERDGCEVVQIFTRSSRAWSSKPLEAARIEAWQLERDRTGIQPCASHASYLINLCATDPVVLEKSREALADELFRCAQLDIPFVVLHPGSHLGAGEAVGIERIAESLSAVFESRPDAAAVGIALENTAGQGTNLGWQFSHLRDIIGETRYPDRLAVCIDTCHAIAAGYDLATDIGYEQTIQAIESRLGLGRVALLHLNDSKRGLGSRIDRHAVLGDGAIGLRTFERLANDARFENCPGILETPSLPDGTSSYAYCIQLLRDLRG